MSDRRARLDLAHCVKDLAEIHYPSSKCIILVFDQLNMHTPAALYAAFSPAEAKRLTDKLELRYTPKHSRPITRQHQKEPSPPRCYRTAMARGGELKYARTTWYVLKRIVTDAPVRESTTIRCMT